MNWMKACNIMLIHRCGSFRVALPRAAFSLEIEAAVRMFNSIPSICWLDHFDRETNTVPQRAEEELLLTHTHSNTPAYVSPCSF